MTIRLNSAVGKHFALYFLLILILLPLNLHADCQITLTWDPNTPAPDGYRIYQRESGESYNYNIFTDAGPSTSSAMSGLLDDTTYHFVVRAYVGSQESGNSNEATYICGNGGTPGNTGGSNPPTQPQAITPSDQAVDVSLQPTLTTSAFIDHDPGDYHAQTRWTIYRLDDDACILDITSSSSLTRLNIPSSTLSPFTSYYWTVCYYDQGGVASAPSPTCDFTTRQATASTPNDSQDSPPASLSSSASTSSSGSSGGGGSGGGCFIQALLGHR